MWHMGDGWGWWMLIGWVWMVIFWGVLIWGVSVIVSRLGDGKSTPPREPTALQILEHRYARGEISHEEFDQMRKNLGATAP